MGTLRKQGKIEARAIKSTLLGLTNMNVGLMLANDVQGNADPAPSSTLA